MLYSNHSLVQLFEGEEEFISFLSSQQSALFSRDMVRLGSVSQWSLKVAIVVFTASCSAIQSASEPIRTIEIQQTWQLQRGDKVGEHEIVAGLGEISIRLNGATAYAPFNGRVQPTSANCVLFSSPDVPAYLFRFCGLNHPNLGEMLEGSAIGSGDYLYFTALRRQPDGTWTIVEPAKSILERIFK